VVSHDTQLISLNLFENNCELLGDEFYELESVKRSPYFNFHLHPLAFSLQGRLTRPLGSAVRSFYQLPVDRQDQTSESWPN
jgi:hypothetical protein